MVGTARGGLVTFNAAGVLDHILTKELGLPSDNITDITSDRQGGIWVTTGDGLARAETALTRFDNASGLYGNSSQSVLFHWRRSSHHTGEQQG